MGFELKKETEAEMWQRLQAEHPPGYTGSPVAPLPHFPEKDKPNPFDAPRHQVDVFTRTEAGRALFEFLEFVGQYTEMDI